MKYVNLSHERIGHLGRNKNNSIMEVVSYKSNRDVWVKFLEHGNLAHSNWTDFCRGLIKNVYDKTTYGVGYLGEGNYSPSENGKETSQYRTWSSMIGRCYNENFHKRHSTYNDVKADNEWLNFQNFAKWYDENYYEIDGEQMHLDKDILVKGNKVYSPETCVFTPQRINKLFLKNDRIRGEFPIGVTFLVKNNIYVARCKNGNGKTINIGRYTTPIQAFTAYKNYKEQLIKQLAEEYKDKIPNKLHKAMMEYEVEITD